MTWEVAPGPPPGKLVHEMKSAAQFMLAFTLISFVSTARATNEPITIIPISVARDRVMVPASLNGTNKLSFLLDTGYTMTMVHPELVELLQLRRAGEITIAGIAGEERAATYEGAKFQLGEAKYAPRRIGAVRDGASRRRRDGVLGSVRTFLSASCAAARPASPATCSVRPGSPAAPPTAFPGGDPASRAAA